MPGLSDVSPNKSLQLRVITINVIKRGSRLGG